MHAVVTTGHGGLDKLVYRADVPVPEPTRGEVLIAVGACSINNTDINTRTGWYAPSVRSGTEVDALLLSFAKTPSGGQAVDLSALIRRH